MKEMKLLRNETESVELFHWSALHKNQVDAVLSLKDLGKVMLWMDQHHRILCVSIALIIFGIHMSCLQAVLEPDSILVKTVLYVLYSVTEFSENLCRMAIQSIDCAVDYADYLVVMSS